ncbi:hypothetical protein CAPTEDRAFT_209191 [Capitella teleta]|uniref:Uncharacterized protein n=1 Tax=Capitella teleta TaxID=283909 RepID=R7VLX3_CAPTE|nr:hypothetical protein CAPTEDRAFT_209191 [Capitella teleta]|eukprot:ELU18636.1 hypothetical protein CAPTEDRAFT_209191 [Capitella teleta]
MVFTSLFPLSLSFSVIVVLLSLKQQLILAKIILYIWYNLLFIRISSIYNNHVVIDDFVVEGSTDGIRITIGVLRNVITKQPDVWLQTQFKFVELKRKMWISLAVGCSHCSMLTPNNNKFAELSYSDFEERIMASLPPAARDGYISAKTVCSPCVSPLSCIERSEVLKAQDFWTSYMLKTALMDEVRLEMRHGGHTQFVSASEWTRRIFSHLINSSRNKNLTTVCGAKNLLDMGYSEAKLQSLTDRHTNPQMMWFLDGASLQTGNHCT